jgi:heme/copper-type cytochrome/quinol oxidase subunit 4
MSRLKSYLVGSALAIAVVAAPVVTALHDSAPAATQVSAMPCMSCWG